MKKMKFRSLLMAFLAAGLLGTVSSCTSDEDKIAKDQEMEVSFAVNVNDVMTRADWVDAEDDGTNDPCPDPNDFLTEVEDGKYEAEFDILMAGDKDVTTKAKVKLNVVTKDGKEYVSTGSFSLTKPASGKHQLTRFVVKDKTSGNVVYSSVDNTSIYNSHVTKHTPVDLDFASNLHSYAKTEVPIEVLCAVTKTPEEFGYVLYTVDAVKVYCVKYMVNICEFPCPNNEGMDTQHKLAKTMAVLQKQVFIDGTWKNTTSHVYETPIDELEIEKGKWMGDFCFNDEGKYPNVNERYDIKIFVDYGEGTVPGWDVEFGGIVSLDSLIDYENSCYFELPDGNETGFLHFNLCEMIVAEGNSIPSVNTNDDCWNNFTIIDVVCPCPPTPECKGCENIETDFTKYKFFKDFDNNAFENLTTNICDWYINKCANIEKDGQMLRFDDYTHKGKVQRAQMITPVVSKDQILEITFRIQSDKKYTAQQLFSTDNRCNDKAFEAMLLINIPTYSYNPPAKCEQEYEVTLTFDNDEDCCRYLITNQLTNCVKHRWIKKIEVKKR